jgi:hypothetical protein
MPPANQNIVSANINASGFIVPKNTVAAARRLVNNVSVIHIDINNDYYSTQRQAEILRTRHVVDSSGPSVISGSARAGDLFSRPPSVRKAKNVSQRSRSYLSGSVNVDAYKTGVEITEIKHWLNGVVKISAGTPGHIIQPIGFGIGEASVQASLNSIEEIEQESALSNGAFREIDLFNPVTFVSLQDDDKKSIEELITFPIVTSDNNQLENYILNGIIEPFPIRSVISNFSVNVPFEPHGVRGAYGNGNSSMHASSDEVLTVDYHDTDKTNDVFFLEEGEPFVLSDGNVSASIGLDIGYFNIAQNYMLPFEDKVLPRGEEISNTYTNDLVAVVNRMLRQGEVYVTNKQRASTSGFVYDGSTKIGTDSIAFGGMKY